MSAANRGAAYITGGSSGIGFAFAAELLRSATPVVLIARNPERLERARDSLSKVANAGLIHGEVGDVSDYISLKGAFDRAAGRAGPPRLLLHTAGIAEPDYFEALTQERYRRQLEINLTGSWNALQLGVAAMRSHKERPCHILTVSSLAGIIPVFGYTAYGATKFGVCGLSLALRQELYREGIYVSVLAPGDMDTPGLLAESATKPPETRALAGNKPLDPGGVARYALKKLYQRKQVIVPSLKNRLELFVYRVAPGLGERIMLHMTKGVSRGRKIHSQ